MRHALSVMKMKKMKKRMGPGRDPGNYVSLPWKRTAVVPLLRFREMEPLE